MLSKQTLLPRRSSAKHIIKTMRRSTKHVILYHLPKSSLSCYHSRFVRRHDLRLFLETVVRFKQLHPHHR